jgi:hypothetical protein
MPRYFWEEPENLGTNAVEKKKELKYSEIKNMSE